MTAATWDNFVDLAAAARDSWNADQNCRLACAYERAAGNYLAMLRQHDGTERVDCERRPALTMLTFSLAGGSVLATMFGAAAAQSVAADVAKAGAIRQAVEKGWEQMLTALAWSKLNAPAKFVMGSLWDELKSKAAPSVFAAIREVSQGARLTSQVGPLEFQHRLASFTDRWYAAVLHSGRWMFDNGGGEEALAALLKSSPFFKPPKKPLDIERTAERIELAFWMKYLLGRGYLETGYEWLASDGALAFTGVSTSTRRRLETWNGRVLRYCEPKYQRVEAVIRDRIDEIHLTLGGGRFFVTRDEQSHTIMRMAEAALAALALSNARTIEAAQRYIAL